MIGVNVNTIGDTDIFIISIDPAEWKRREEERGEDEMGIKITEMMVRTPDLVSMKDG